MRTWLTRMGTTSTGGPFGVVARGHDLGKVPFEAGHARSRPRRGGFDGRSREVATSPGCSSRPAARGRDLAGVPFAASRERSRPRRGALRGRSREVPTSPGALRRGCRLSESRSWRLGLVNGLGSTGGKRQHERREDEPRQASTSITALEGMSRSITKASTDQLGAPAFVEARHRVGKRILHERDRAGDHLRAPEHRACTVFENGRLIYGSQGLLRSPLLFFPVSPAADVLALVDVVASKVTTSFVSDLGGTSWDFPAESSSTTRDRPPFEPRAAVRPGGFDRIEDTVGVGTSSTSSAIGAGSGDGVGGGALSPFPAIGAGARVPPFTGLASLAGVLGDS